MVSQTPTTTKNSELKFISASDMCRICMLPGDYFKNSSHEITTRICRMLKTSTQIDISLNDGYPQILCSNCYKQLYESYKFVLLAKSTQKELRKNPPQQNNINIVKEKTPVFESKVENTLSPIKENIENINNIIPTKKIEEQIKKNNTVDLVNSVSKKSAINKDEINNQMTNKRLVLRSNIKKEDVTIIENNNSIDLTQSPVEENIPNIPEIQETISQTPLETIPTDKKRRTTERTGSKTKEVVDIQEIQIIKSESSPIDKNTIEKKTTSPILDISTQSIPSTSSSPSENQPIEKKRMNKKTLSPENNEEVVQTEVKRRSSERVASKAKENDTKVDLAVSNIHKISSDDARNLDELVLKIDTDEINENTSVDKENLSENKVKKVLPSPKKVLLTKNKKPLKKKNDNEDKTKLVQTSIASFYMSSPEKEIKRELLSPTQAPILIDEIRIPDLQVIISNDSELVCERKPVELNPVVEPPQKVGDKRKRNSNIEKQQLKKTKVEPSNEKEKQKPPPKEKRKEKKKKVFKKVVVTHKKNADNKFKKKVKKTFIKINTKYLTRTIKGAKDGKKKKQEKDGMISPKKEPGLSESTTPVIDDILSAVGLIPKTKKSSESGNESHLEKYECEICKMKFNWTECYRRHLANAHKLKPYECRYCKEKFTSAMKLRTHRNEAHEAQIKPYKCIDCEQSFKTFDKHLIHVREVHNLTKYICKLCRADFATQELLDGHLHRHKTVEEEIIVIKDEVDKDITSDKIIVKEEVKKPVKVRAKVLNSANKNSKFKFQCEQCSKQFCKASDLVRHNRVHTGEKPFACKLCNQKFQQRPNLQKHIITVHAEKKLFTCDICHKTFGRHDSMLRHMLTHSLEKPFTCQECKKCFVRQSQLDTHFKRNHTNSKNSQHITTEM